MANAKIRKDPFYHHEALDRTSLLLEILQCTLSDHRFIAAWPDLKNRVQQIELALGELYVAVGSLDPADNEEQETRDAKKAKVQTEEA